MYSNNSNNYTGIRIWSTCDEDGLKWLGKFKQSIKEYTVFLFKVVFIHQLKYYPLEKAHTVKKNIRYTYFFLRVSSVFLKCVKI